MTREEAKDKMLTDSVQYKNGLKTVALRKINNFIDKIFDEHEAQLKAKDKEIQAMKCCSNCKYSYDSCYDDVGTCIGNDKWELYKKDTP